MFLHLKKYLFDALRDALHGKNKVNNSVDIRLIAPLFLILVPALFVFTILAVIESCIKKAIKLL